MKTRFELATLLASLLFFLQPAAQSPSATLPGVPATVREAMLQYKCASAPGDVLAPQDFVFKVE